MDMLTPLVMACSLLADVPFVTAIATAASEQQPYYLRLDGRKYGQGFVSKDHLQTALGRLSTKQAFVGPLGVPRSLTDNGDVSIQQLLNPCRNITIGTEYLALYLDECRASHAANPKACAAKLYGQWIGREDREFRVDVARLARRAEAKAPIAIDAQSFQQSEPRPFRNIQAPQAPRISRPTPPVVPHPPAVGMSP